MSYIKADNEIEQEHSDFLEELRQDGVVNMWGAAPYLRREFPDDFKATEKFPDDVCGAVLQRWMKFHEDPSRVMEPK